MPNFLISVIIVALAVVLASKLFNGVRIKNNATALLVGLVFGVLDLFIGWLVKFVVALALIPAAIVTIGLVYLLLGFFVNCALLWITDKLMASFQIKRLSSLFATSAMISLVSYLATKIHFH